MPRPSYNIREMGEQRVIDGKLYKRTDTYARKKDAESTARIRTEQLGYSGLLFRVVKVKEGWAIFEHQGNAPIIWSRK